MSDSVIEGMHKYIVCLKIISIICTYVHIYNNSIWKYTIYIYIYIYHLNLKCLLRTFHVFDSDGMNRTGTFICIYSEVEHLRLEGTVDVFQSVKIARCKRPHLVTTEVRHNTYDMSYVHCQAAIWPYNYNSCVY